MDEPSKALDAAGQDQLIFIIKELRKKNLGIVIVDHNIQQVLKYCDRILCLNQSFHWHDTHQAINRRILSRPYRCEFEHPRPRKRRPHVTDILNYPFLQITLGVVLLLSLTAGLLSPVIISKGMAFMGASISHAAFLGIGIGLHLFEPHSPGVFLSTLATTTLLSFLLAKATFKKPLPQRRRHRNFLSTTMGMESSFTPPPRTKATSPATSSATSSCCAPSTSPSSCS